jgi:hypothetical protein
MCREWLTLPAMITAQVITAAAMPKASCGRLKKRGAVFLALA